MSDVSRRRLLAVTGTALVGTIAGCSSSDDDTDDSDEPNGDAEPEAEDGETGSETTEIDGTILGEITIDNLSDAGHEVDVLVEFNREIEDWATESLGAGNGVTLERNWPSDPGQFRVTARLDQDELLQVTPANWNDPDCLNLYVRIDRDGALSLLGDTSSGPCGDGDVELDDADE